MSGASGAKDRRAWRILFICVAVALTVGTHWPRLEIDLGGEPAPDKMLHAGAFGLATLLLWTTGWIRSRWALLGIGVAWATVDELTQGLPGLSRTISAHDAIASSVGVVLATALLWCAAPVRAARAGRVAELRLARSVERAISGPTAALAIVAGGAAGGVIGTVIGWAISWIFINPRPAELALLGLGLGGLVGAHFIVEVRRRSVLARAVGRCLRCGAAAQSSTEGWTRCANCGESRHAIHDGLPPVPARTIGSLLLIAVAITAGAVIALLTALAIAVAVWTRSEALRRVSYGWNELPPGMSFVLDLLWVGLLLAITARVLRRRLARRLDAQGERCLGCGHDLRATPVQQWRGRCGECGAEFVRIRSDPSAVA